ncbi:hypothetical protein ASE40_02715 [Flavobacterium sp. Root935]|uniref:DUF6252 family protein n=1 Tax=Flavobacterium sp. Root935 TaxID=1736610 RepID=UPI00070F04E4|nr:DUF6252 family protein [Flavobacterium sp. Root935]KRD62717.1 hypothetical protein ASE40_02715 [Flavobacterium sp. Root935]
MKILKKIMFLSFAICALVLSSCSSDNSSDDTDTPSSQEGFMKFKYNETVYTFAEPALISSGSINIMGSTGIDNTYKKISLWTPLNITTGSHPIVFDLSNLTTTYHASFSFMPEIENADATSGTINIIVNDDKKIEGTFSFSGTSKGKTFTVTEGSFRIIKW